MLKFAIAIICLLQHTEVKNAKRLKVNSELQ